MRSDQSPSYQTRATKNGYFVIADISGYTSFLARSELSHAQGILAEITELLIEKLSAPLRFIELEGDAVFVFAPEVAVEDSERLVDIMEACYAAFRIRLDQMQMNTSCKCAACRMIPELDLKCVAHFGRFLPQKTPTGTKLVGPDVILVHRLLKNSVTEKTGIKAYALLTDEFINKAAFAEGRLGLPRYVETIPELGSVEGGVLDLAASVDKRRAAARQCIGAKDADVELVVDLPATRSFVWGYFVDTKRRLTWQQDTRSVENHPGANGRSGVGWESHCDHGRYRMNHRIIDWQPFDYLSMVTTATGKSIVKPPNNDITFTLEELGENQCRLFMRVRLHDRGIWSRLKLLMAKPILLPEWRMHFSVLKRILYEDLTLANEAVDSKGIEGLKD